MSGERAAWGAGASSRNVPVSTAPRKRVRVSWTPLACTAALVAACASEHRPRVTLEVGARTPAPSFIIDAPVAPHFIDVERASGRPGRAGDTSFWRLVRRADTTVTPPIHLVYGTVPPGYRSVAPAAMLFPAEYRVRVRYVHDISTLTFSVHADGSVR